MEVVLMERRRFAATVICGASLLCICVLLLGGVPAQPAEATRSGAASIPEDVRANGAYIEHSIAASQPATTTTRLYLPFVASAPLPPGTEIGLDGDISITPYVEDQPEESRPVAYTVLLDVSGSMMWHFEGVGLYAPDGRYYQCESKRFGSLYPFIGDTEYEECGDLAAWPDYTERRIYSVREVVRSIVATMSADDRMRIIAFSSDIRGTSADWFDASGTLPGGENVENHIIEIGQCDGLYKTCGETAGPLALDQARAWITNADGQYPFEEDESGNPLPTEPLRPVVIYITDGTPNMLLDGSRSPGNPACAGLDPLSMNHSVCQLGYSAQGETLPLTSMQEIAQEMKDAMQARGEDDFVLYVLGIGRVDLGGLDRVASGGVGTLFLSRSGEEAQAIVTDIQNDIVSGACMVEMQEEVRRVASANEPENREVLVDPRPEDVARYGDDIYGYVTITESTTETISLPIHHNDADQLVVELEQANVLAPGEYTLEAWIYYNASGETGDTRLYNRLYDHSTGQKVESLTFTVEPGAGSHVRLPDMHLDLPDTDIWDTLCS
jgi:hypothetical protein